MLAILNKILANRLDSDAVTAKLDELIRSNMSSGKLQSPSSTASLKLELGDSGAVFELEPDKSFVLPILGEPSLTIEKVEGHILVSTHIRNALGKLVAEIDRNEWKVRPGLLWDRNYDENALELQDEAGDVILQVVVLADRVRIQGIWRDESGACTEIVNDPRKPGGLVLFPTYDACKLRPSLELGSGLLRIKPIFVYPSERHFGERKRL